VQRTQCAHRSGTDHRLRIAGSGAKQLYGIPASELADEANGRGANLLIGVGKAGDGDGYRRLRTKGAQRLQGEGAQRGLWIM
jgi:hypothetical protein